MPPLPGQRTAQQAQRAGTQSARAMGRAARTGGGLSAQIVYQRPDRSWWAIECDENGRECETPYEINIEREV